MEEGSCNDLSEGCSVENSDNWVDLSNSRKFWSKHLSTLLRDELHLVEKIIVVEHDIKFIAQEILWLLRL